MPDPIDPSADQMHEALEALRRKYRERRRRWAWRIGRPYSEDTQKPDPGSLDLSATEDGF